MPLMKQQFVFRERRGPAVRVIISVAAASLLGFLSASPAAALERDGAVESAAGVAASAIGQAGGAISLRVTDFLSFEARGEERRRGGRGERRGVRSDGGGRRGQRSDGGSRSRDRGKGGGGQRREAARRDSRDTGQQPRGERGRGHGGERGTSGQQRREQSAPRQQSGGGERYARRDGGGRDARDGRSGGGGRDARRGGGSGGRGDYRDQRRDRDYDRRGRRGGERYADRDHRDGRYVSRDQRRDYRDRRHDRRYDRRDHRRDYRRDHRRDHRYRRAGRHQSYGHFHGRGPRRGHGYYCNTHFIFHYFAGYDPVGWYFARHYGYDAPYGCRTVERIRYRRGRRFVYGAVMCYDDWGYPYILRGSEYVYRRY